MSMLIFSVFVSAAVTFVLHQKEIITYETVGINYYYECVSVVSDSQHKKRIRHTILLSVACLALLYFCTLSHKRQDFRVKHY